MKLTLFFAFLLVFPPLESGGSGGIVIDGNKGVPFDLSIVSEVNQKTGDLVFTLTTTKIPLVIANPKTKLPPTVVRLHLAELEEHLKEPVVINGVATIVVPLGKGVAEARRSQILITVNGELVFGGGARIYAIKRN